MKASIHIYGYCTCAYSHMHGCCNIGMHTFPLLSFLDLGIQCSIVLIMYEFMGEESSQSIKHPQAREKRACKGNKQKDRIFVFS